MGTGSTHHTKDSMQQDTPSISPAAKGLPVPQTLFIIALTVVYLLVEMAFNARLLDVAGGLQSGKIESLEQYGRLLSGIAVALFVLQFLLTKRAKRRGQSPHILSIIFWCLLSVLLTYGALKFVVDAVVHASTSQFRKASVNMLLVREEMLHGRALIAGLGDDPSFYAQPEGKAFLALFPAFGAMIWPQMDKTLGPVKIDLLAKSTDAALGGVENFYKGAYKKAIQQVAQMYRGDYPSQVIADISQREFDRAWAQYEADLKTRGWTPYNVPSRAKRAVAAEMQKRIGVPRDWAPSDQHGFHQAITNQVRAKLKNNTGTLYDSGKVVASDLSWSAYVAHPVTQKHLQEGFSLPASVPVLATYASGDEFETKLYRPIVRARAAQELQRLALPDVQFKTGGIYASAGFDAAKAAIAAPMALWFSLLGAISHLAKLIYQVMRLVTLYLPAGRFVRYLPLAAPLLVVGIITAGIALSDTAATSSGAHQFLRQQALDASQDNAPWFQTRIALGVMHMVEVGQSHAYPINNFIRHSVLGGFQFDTPLGHPSLATRSMP